MKIGDLVMDNILFRIGIIEEEYEFKVAGKILWKVSWFPKPEYPVFGNLCYSDHIAESDISLISSV